MEWTDKDTEALRRSSLVYYTGATPPADIVQRAAAHILALEAKLAAPPWETLNVLDGDIDRLRARMALAASELRKAQESWRLVADTLVSADNPAGLLRGCAHRIDGIAARLEQGDENEGEENDHT